jgi:hypothetical protein
MTRLSERIGQLPPRARLALVVAAEVVLIAALWLLSGRLGGGVDWFSTQRPATLNVLRGRSPYEINVLPGHDSLSYFYNPPWTVIPLIPLAALPPALGRAVFVAAGVLAYGYTVYKMGASPLATILFLLSPPVLMGLWNANIDWLVLLGFVLPPQIGLFFVTVKPQMGIAVVVFWLAQALRKGGVREAVRVFWPITLATAASFVLFGLWPLDILRAPVGEGFNASFWPMSIPVGLVALAVAIRQERIEFAVAASPCFATYLTFHSWVGAVAALARSDLYMALAVAGLYAVGLTQLLYR